MVTHPHPPQDFHPLSASGAELERYGFPPRPDAVRARTPYAHWKKIVSVPRVANPTLQQTTIYNGPIRNMSICQTLQNGIVSTTSPNWSGYAIIGAIGTFEQNNAYVFSQWVVPRAQQGFGVCHGFGIILRNGTDSMALVQTTSCRPAPKRTRTAQVRHQYRFIQPRSNGTRSRRPGKHSRCPAR